MLSRFDIIRFQKKNSVEAEVRAKTSLPGSRLKPVSAQWLALIFAIYTKNQVEK